MKRKTAMDRREEAGQAIEKAYKVFEDWCCCTCKYSGERIAEAGDILICDNPVEIERQGLETPLWTTEGHCCDQWKRGKRDD